LLMQEQAGVHVLTAAQTAESALNSTFS
jgi:hypothetical protein